MSIIYGPLPPELVDAERESLIVFVYRPLSASVCFYCSQDLAYPVVQWHGDGDIFLHHDCAEQLGMRLCMDGLLASKGRKAVMA